MNNADERQKNRIKLLQFIALAAGHDPTPFIYSNKILNSGDVPIEEINGHIFYLNQKGYLEIAPLKSSQSSDSFAWAKITSKGIDLVEKIEQNRDTTEFENDFSKDAIVVIKNSYNINVGDMENSQIQQNTINSNQNLEIGNNSLNELQTILDKIKNDEPANNNIITPIEAELKKVKIDWNKINSYLQTLLSISQIATQLFTPELRNIFGLK